MGIFNIRHLRLIAVALIAPLWISLVTAEPVSNASEGEAGESDASASSEIIDRYLQATHTHEDSQRGASMEVEIDANVPTLKKEGKLHALRQISKVGQISYRVLGFQGDNTVKKEVIARYLTAEQQAQSDNQMSVTPANYKLKFKGKRTLTQGGKVYVFQLSPRKKRLGLFKGEIWLDAKTYLPVYEKGRLVKNPSIFFKTVDFERAFSIQNGAAIPQHMNSTIDTRLIGRVQLNVDYTNYNQPAAPDASPLSGSPSAVVLR